MTDESNSIWLNLSVQITSLAAIVRAKWKFTTHANDARDLDDTFLGLVSEEFSISARCAAKDP